MSTLSLTEILSIEKEIIDEAEQVKINKRQCQTLTQRIQTVTSYLQNPEILKQIEAMNNPLNDTLELFRQFLSQCNEFLSFLIDHSSIQKFSLNSNDKDQFTQLNQQLQMHYSELTLGMINLTNLIDPKQDEYDQNEDFQELLITIIEHQSQTLQQQAKRIRQLEKHSQQRQSRPSNNIFQNGIWSNQCFEEGKWHGPFENELKFNFKDNVFYGRGDDHLGAFLLTGTFSKEKQQINTLLVYRMSFQSGRDQEYELQLTWNEKQRQFQGFKHAPIGWSVMADGSFEMSFVRAVKNYYSFFKYWKFLI